VKNLISRRRLIQSSMVGLAASQALGLSRAVRGQDPMSSRHGAICGEPTAERVGGRVLAEGGNVVDAIVAGALSAAVSAIHQTGIGGYGGSMILALEHGQKITAIDFNSAAPAAMTADFFAPSKKGIDEKQIRDQRHGWLASGVPGILAGLQLAIDRYGSRSFGQLVQPAIAITRDGFVLPASVANVIKTHQATFTKDAGSKKLYLTDGTPPQRGSTFRNHDTLADRNSAESFYRGDIAQQIADCFQKNGGLVTTTDLNAYQAKELKPLSLDWNGFAVHTPPLTSGGLTVLQALHILEVMNWPHGLSALEQTHARIEALRKSWHSRLTLLGDPDKSPVPVDKLLSAAFARESAEQISAAIKREKRIDYDVQPREQGGTIHLSGFDDAGNLAALTLTHGDSFGAQVTVDGLGLTLGHGMSRFESRADHPNSPGPGKRPLHNMCPTIVLKDGKPQLAAGARGGRKIPNALFEVLVQMCGLHKNAQQAVASPRLHTEGAKEVTFEKAWPAPEVEHCRRLGYKTVTGSSATVSAVGYEEKQSNWAVAQR
jgi:gamma-glutamyltranspeptidase/glutathione hydrolase